MSDNLDVVNKGDQPVGSAFFGDVKFPHQNLIQEELLLDKDAKALSKLSVQTTIKGITSLTNWLVVIGLLADQKIRSILAYKKNFERSFEYEKEKWKKLFTNNKIVSKNNNFI